MPPKRLAVHTPLPNKVLIYIIQGSFANRKPKGNGKAGKYALPLFSEHLARAGQNWVHESAIKMTLSKWRFEGAPPSKVITNATTSRDPQKHVSTSLPQEDEENQDRRRKPIEPLPRVNHEEIEYLEVEFGFYKPHPERLGFFHRPRHNHLSQHAVTTALWIVLGTLDMGKSSCWDLGTRANSPGFVCGVCNWSRGLHLLGLQS